MTKLLKKNCILTFVVALVAVLCLQSFIVSDAEAANNKIYIDDRLVTTDVAPVVVNSRVLVPIRVVSEGLGAQVSWDNPSQTVTVKKGSVTLKMVANKTTYTKNGVNKTMDVPVKVIKNRTLVPIRVVSEDLGAGVQWDKGNVYVQSGGELIIKVNQLGAGGYLNLRQGPGTNYPIVGKVNSGDYLSVITRSGDWYKIQTKNGDDAYVSKNYVTIYSGGTSNNGTGGGTVEPQPEPEPTPPTTDQNGNLLVTDRTTGTGQSSIAFDIGTGTPSVVSNNGNQIVVKISGVQLSADNWQPAENMAPFTGLKVNNNGSDSVLLTASVSDKGYFRLDINGSTFTVTAVAKHKNGTTGLAGKTIVVSPGHGVYGAGGAIDRGAVSPINGLDEVDFNTPLSLKLRDKLEAAGATVIMIRDTEGPINMSLYERSVLTNNANADAFVEIHGDSAANAAAKGIGTWIYTDNTRLTTAAQKDMRNEFGSVMNQALANTTGQPAYVKYGNFSVIRETEVPCVLVECGFLTNAEDAARLATDAYQEKLAQGIYNGLANYFAY
ncbi:MAG: N-acetylmuramoyl-L-alanine amidase [Peptococcaceae bacterium]|jgi:N-acetylmuramoyl-L-alanine amidase|nr:N-acetylmuramoyl-L-alanine amidase [Peptococcaceae bacterium]